MDASIANLSRQHTVGSVQAISGIGVHSGASATMTLHPAHVDSGVVFVRTDVSGKDNRIPALCEKVSRTQLNTEIANGSGVSVSTIEHLMAALAALGVDNVVVEIDGPEAPIMDGSALPFVELIERAGVVEQAADRRFVEIRERIEVRDGDKWASLSPLSEGFEVAFELVYASKAIGRQTIDLRVTAESFKRELAAARTFGFESDIAKLQAMGLGRGASLENAVGLDGDVILNPEGLRMEREFVRHKALDAIGDLYTLGGPIIGRYECSKGGHALNNALCRAVMAHPRAWRWRPPLLAAKAG